MRRWKPWVLTVCLAASAGAVMAQSPADAVVQQLREQGYVEVEVTRTLLGRIRVVALASDGTQREIVFSPTTGEILRDYVETVDGGPVAPQIMDRPAGGSAGSDAAPTGTDESRGARSGQGPGTGSQGADNGNGQGNGNGSGNDGGPGNAGQGNRGGQGNAGQGHGNGPGGGRD